MQKDCLEGCGEEGFNLIQKVVECEHNVEQQCVLLLTVSDGLIKT